MNDKNQQALSVRILQQLKQEKNEQFSQDIFDRLSGQNFQGFLPHFAVEQLTESYSVSCQTLALMLLPVAACYASTPISHFNVGAVVIGESGNFYFGANQEFCTTHIQQTIHAEQSAISHAWMRGEVKLTDIAVNYTPCGHCRQFMNELNCAQTLQIHLPHCQNNRLYDYLPDAFGPQNLAISSRLFDPKDHHLCVPNDDPVVSAAVSAANQAHAPYSNTYSGVALQLMTGEIFCGRYAENAAFNPSLPAFQSAVNYLLLSGHRLDEVKRAILVEKAGSLSYFTGASDLLKQFASFKLEYIKL